jgi:CO dehydrogenase/acetyl-CoA synthase beta subunit
MGLFDKSARDLNAFVENAKAGNRLCDLSRTQPSPWPAQSSLVLEEDTAIELGNPSIGSSHFIVWSDQKPAPKGDGVFLLGPDIRELEQKRHPFAQVLSLRGRFDDPYDCYRQIKTAVYQTELDGFMVRSMPSRQSLWCRISKSAVAGGFSLAHLGRALLDRLQNLSFIDRVQIFFVTSGKEDVARLKMIGEQVEQIVGALVKLNEVSAHDDCDSCDYQQVCADLDELAQLRDRVLQEHQK